MAIREINDENEKRYDLRALLGKADGQHKRVAATVKATAEPYWTMEEVDVRDVLTAAYQRPIRDHKIRKMLREGWKPLKARAIELSRRRDGSVFVVDGQHRIVAITRMNGRAPYRQRVVMWHGLTPEQEAEMFAETQTPENRTPVLPEERHNARLEYNDQAIRIDEMLAAVGFHIGPRDAAVPTRRIKAVQELYRIDDAYGPEMLDATLKFIVLSWGADHSPEAPLLGGVAEFIAMYPDANYENLARRLGKSRIDRWLEDADRMGDALKIKAKRDRVARYLFEEYNHTHRKNPLTDFDGALKAHTFKMRSEAAKAQRARRREAEEAGRA